MSSLKHFVLVHGAGHGAWCWYKIRCQLEQHGHKVTCLDLAGCGIDFTDPNHITTFDDYNKPLFDFMTSLPDNDKVVLVGHSAGGLSVTSTIREFSGKVETAVYVAADMLRNGFLTPEDLVVGIPSGARTASGTLTPECLRQLLYNMSPPEDITLAFMLKRPSPKLEPAKFPEERKEADRVRRVYIKTLEDMALKPKQQETMIEMWPPNQVFSLETDHSPFFSAPSQLSDILLNI